MITTAVAYTSLFTVVMLSGSLLLAFMSAFTLLPRRINCFIFFVFIDLRQWFSIYHYYYYYYYVI